LIHPIDVCRPIILPDWRRFHCRPPTSLHYISQTLNFSSFKQTSMLMTDLSAERTFNAAAAAAGDDDDDVDDDQAFIRNTV